MNQRPFHAVRWLLPQLFIVVSVVGGFLSVVYFFMLFAFWLTQVIP